MIGSTIGHYQILEKLGEGGMGVVYKAQDMKLDRLVALKFLPEHLHSSDAERARFLQEAKAAAMLNHPNICTIHDILVEEGKNFIVMELVDGVTLREKFGTTPIPARDAITYAIQIGEALEDAHNKGIVHRDIKSDNIMVNKKNQVKVMDFGLAKLRDSLRLTKATSTVGTLSYMAPEQIQGAESDARSDIFSFGVVLFEMLTSRLPFRGEHDAAMMYSILNEEPESLQKFLPDSPLVLIQILNTALEKQRDDRYQTITEMVRDLRRAQKQTSRVSRVIDTGSVLSELQLSPARKRILSPIFIYAGVGILLLFSLLVVFVLTSSVKLNPHRTLKVIDVPFTQIQYPGLSPDGKWLTFPATDANGTWDIYIMNVSGNEPKRITTEASANAPVSFFAGISPDGSQIVYNLINQRTNKSEIRLVASLGGRSKVLAEEGTIPRWRPDGERIGFLLTGDQSRFRSKSGRSELWSVQPNGADLQLEFVDTIGKAPSANSFAWSPDGRSIVWLRTVDTGYPEVIKHELSTGEESQLTFDNGIIDEVCWTSNDQIIYSSNKSGNWNLWMVPANGGESVQITNDEGPDRGMTISSDTKRFLYFRSPTYGFIWRAGMDGSAEKQLTFESQGIGWARFSPNREQIVFSSSGRDQSDSKYGIYIMDREGQNRRKLVSPSENNNFPIWSPDGKWIAYLSHTVGTNWDSSKIFVVDAINDGLPRQVTKGRFSVVWIAPQTLVVQRGSRLWHVNIFTGQEEPFFEDSTLALPVGKEKYITYLDRRLGRAGIWIVPFDYQSNEQSVKPRLVLSSAEPYANWFSEDRSMQLLWDDQGRIWKILYPSLKRERVHGSFPGLTRASSISTSYDNKEILYVQRRLDAKLVMIENLFK